MRFSEPIEVILKSKGTRVYSIAPDATVYEALQRMAEANIGALVVLDGSSLVGMFSERDYARKVVLKARSSKELRVREIMTTPVVTAVPSTSIDDCMHEMTTTRCRHLPIVDEGKVVGLVSIGDLVKWIISAQEFALHQLEGYVTGKYPA